MQGPNSELPYETYSVSPILSPPPHTHTHTPDKTLLRLGNKELNRNIQELYRNIQTFAFKVLQECSSWASRNDVVQIFFLTPHRRMFAGKFLKSERFLVVFLEHIIFNVKWVKVRKMSQVFLAKLYCKMCDLSC